MKSLRVLPVLAVLGTFCATVKPASAQFIYDTSVNLPGFVVINTEFEVPSILTSVTTISSFTSASDTLGPVTGEILAPTATGSCLQYSGPCLAVETANNFVTTLQFSTPFTSVGTYFPDNGVPGSLTISAVSSVPEPSSILLLLSLCGVVAFAYRKRFRAIVAS